MKLPILSLVANRKWLVVLFVISLSTFHFSLFANGVFAAAGDEPDPKPCEKAISTYDQLTDNYVVDPETGEPPFVEQASATGPENSPVTISKTVTFEVDFSKLQAIFGASNSDYQEGKFQDEKHQKDSIIDLNSSDFNKYHGPGQKSIPKTMVNEMKVKYVEYIYNNPHLPEASSKYTDTRGENPARIYDLIQQGFPNPPVPPKPGEDRTQWLEKWGKYWEKIPTTYNEFYRGYLVFRGLSGNEAYKAAQGEEASGFAGEICPVPVTGRPPIEFIMPEFKRTVSISDELNKVIVPCSAQSFRHGTDSDPNSANSDDCKTLAADVASRNIDNRKSGNFLSNALKACRGFLTKTPKKLLDGLKNTISSLNKISPLKDAYAADPTPSPSACIKLLAKGKEGFAPYCALPEKNADGLPQLQPGDTCRNIENDPLKLDTGTNVICTFSITYSAPLKIDSQIEDGEQSNWDSCGPATDGSGNYTCTTTVRIFPVFRIPFLAEIWNNTLYSDDSENGVTSLQKTGRPGVYSNFIPKAVYSEMVDGGLTREKFLELEKNCKGNNPEDLDTPACQELFDFLTELEQKYPEIAAASSCDPLFPTRLLQCFAPYWQRIPSRNLPGQIANNVQGAKDSNVLGATNSDQKERFIGATDCGKFQARDKSLKPKALQEYLGIGKDCNLQSAAPPGGTDPRGSGGDCGNNSAFAGMLPNPIPDSVNPTSTSALPNLADGILINAAKSASSATGLPCEILIGLQFVETGGSWDNTASFISGRRIGTPEPDVTSAAECQSYGGTMGTDVITGRIGCIFPSLESTALYAARLFQDKVMFLTGGGAPRSPSNFDEMIGAMSRYNGGGNSNCGEPVPYAGPCPPPEGIDDPYAVNNFDSSHAAMYLLYCADFTRCDPPREFSRDGAATAAKEFYLSRRP